MKRFSKIAALFLSVAVATSTCVLFAGCGSTPIAYNDFTAVVEEFKSKMSLAKDSSLDVSVMLDIETTDDETPLSINGTTSNKMIKSGNNMLDLTNSLQLSSSWGITDDIDLLVGNTFDFGSFDIKIKQGQSVNESSTHKIYVRDDTEYIIRNGKLTTMTVGEQFDGDLSRSIVDRYVSAAANIEGFFNTECKDYLLYPSETFYSNPIKSIKCLIQDVGYSAQRTGDKLQLHLSITASHKSEGSFIPYLGMNSNDARREYYGHFRNRDFRAGIVFTITMDASASISKKEFDELDLASMTKDVLYLSCDSYENLKAGILGGNVTEIPVLGGGDETYMNLVYKDGSYKKETTNTCDINIQCLGYIDGGQNLSTYTTKRDLTEDRYDFSGNNLTVYSAIFSKARQDLEKYVNSGESRYTVDVRSITITLTYKTLVEMPSVNESGYYDSDQYRTFTNTITIYKSESSS